MGAEYNKLKSCLGKRQYVSLQEACVNGKFSMSENKITLYAYLCTFCNKWHLTRSKTKYKVI